MAFPWLFEEGSWAAGGRGNFDAETDTDSILDYPHYPILAQSGLAPYNGAYCIRIRGGTGTNSAYVQENASFDTAAAGTIHFQWFFFLAPDFTMAANDKFSMVELESVADTTTDVAAGLDRSTNNIRLWVARTAAASAQTFVLGDITDALASGRSPLGRWYHVEISALIDNGGGDNGTIDAYLDGATVGSQITGLDQGAIVDAKFGMIGKDAGTTGTLLIDWVRADDARIYMPRERFPTQITVTQSRTIFVGPGYVDAAALLSTTSGNIMRLYDTDTGNANDAQGFVVECDLSAFPAFEGPATFERGCYAQLTGTNPRGQVLLPEGTHHKGLAKPLYYSDWGYRHYGQRRKGRGQNI